MDFLIGAHALAQCDRLLTRDRGFYKEYFGKIRIVDPAVQQIWDAAILKPEVTSDDIPVIRAISVHSD